MTQKAKKVLLKIFGSERPLIGMIHFPPLIGLAEYPGFEFIKNKMLQEVKILEKGGVDAIMIENNYDLPHHEKVSSMTAAMIGSLAQIVCQSAVLPAGINILWNDYETALAICASTRLSFFRVPAFVDTVKTSYGIMKARSTEVVALRKKLGLENIAILADIQVKHSEMVDKNKSIDVSAREAIDAGADALIVTGKWTGDAPRADDLRVVRETVKDFPILIGSGATKENLPLLITYADGIIVGTDLKEGVGHSKEEEVNIKPYQANISLVRTVDFVKSFRNLG